MNLNDYSCSVLLCFFMGGVLKREKKQSLKYIEVDKV